MGDRCWRSRSTSTAVRASSAPLSLRIRRPGVERDLPFHPRRRRYGPQERDLPSILRSNYVVLLPYPLHVHGAYVVPLRVSGVLLVVLQGRPARTPTAMAIPRRARIPRACQPSSTAATTRRSRRDGGKRRRPAAASTRRGPTTRRIQMLQIRRRQEGIAYIPGVTYILSVELHIRDSVIRSQLLTALQGRRRCRGGIHPRYPLPLRRVRA